MRAELPYEKSPRFRAAKDWAERFGSSLRFYDHEKNMWCFRGVSGIDVKLQFAEASHRLCLDTHKLHDDRADSLFRFGAVLAAGLASVVKITSTNVLWAAPSLLCFGLTVVFALIAKWIDAKPIPMKVSDVLELEGEDEAIQTFVAISYHSVVEGYWFVLDRKARWNNLASSACVCGIALLLLLLIA